MGKLFSSPLRVYLALGVLALIGVVAGLKLPISLYPNSNKPTISVDISFGNLTAEEFSDEYGQKIESQLQAISTDNIEIENVTSDYGASNARFELEFKWGTEPKAALREVETIMNGLSSAWPKEIRDSLSVNFWSKSSGFIAISFFSEKRDLNELYKILDPVIIPKLAKVKDAQNPTLWNPGQKEVSIILNPEAMASLGLFPRHIEMALEKGMSGYLAGSVVVGTNKLSIQMPRAVEHIQALKDLIVELPSQKLIHLSEVAEVDIAEASDSNQIFKTNGTKSLILFASPRTGGNVKRMAEEILEIVQGAMPNLPKDIEYKVLVDPSEFIRSSVNNLFKEVMLAAVLAVIVLFVFIGSFKNTITAAVEIPLSMVMAFILMKMTDMNLNLISLGGLALAAGMNVDASVVVMENIFRHFEETKGELTFAQRLEIIVKAVREVALPIVASTIATLVVFAPLAFTSDLTDAILGDLAKAVVFSHGLSMFIALILVPTVRLQLMGKKTGPVEHHKSPIDGTLNKLENLYCNSLEKVIHSKKLKWLFTGSMLLGFAVLLIFVAPRLRKEIIGIPDTDWMVLSVSTQGNTLIQQMDSQAAQIEARLLTKFGNDIKYTFTQIQQVDNGVIMARLKDKKEMGRLWKAMEAEFKNEPNMFFWVGPWNPAELPIPDPPQMRLVVQGGGLNDRMVYANALRQRLEAQDVFPRIWTEPSVERREEVSLAPHFNRWPVLEQQGVHFSPFDVTDLIRVATDGRSLGRINFDNESLGVRLKYPNATIVSKEDIEAIPLMVGDKLVPVKAIMDVNLSVAKPPIYRENGRDIITIEAKQDKGKDHLNEAALAHANKVVAEFEQEDHSSYGIKDKPIVIMEDAQKELNLALKQLGVAIGLSILLIFLTLLLQFGDFGHSMIIMVAVPLGIMGGILSLWIFDSTLSLNSALGIIMLNGVAVNNSIILVDFVINAYEEGMSPLQAVLLGARKRLRPILITSLTTILGMVPISLGTGEGGKILQPLGISVAGGLWFSTLFTFFAVPLLEIAYLNWKQQKATQTESNLAPTRKRFPLIPGFLFRPRPAVATAASVADSSDEVPLQ